MPLGVLRHVDADHGALVVEEEVGERLGQLGLADTGGAEEEEGPGRTVGIRDPGPRAPDRVGHGLHRGGLADQPLADDLLHVQQLLGLTLEQTAGGDAGPRGDDLGDGVGVDLLLHHRPTRGDRRDGRLGLGGLSRLDLTFEAGDLAIHDRSRIVEPALADHHVRARACLVELSLELTDPVEAGLLGLPAGVETRELLAAVGDLLAEPRQPLARGVVGLLLQVQLLHLEAVDLAAELVDLDGRGVDLHAQPRRRLVDEVDGLVGELAAGDVAVGQRGRGHEGRVGDRDLVVRLVALLEPTQDRDGVLDGRLAHEDLLEAPLQGRVLLDVLAVLVQGGRADEPQLAAGQEGLEHVARVHGRVAGGAGAHDRVDLVDEGDDLAVGLADLVEDGLEPLLELAAVLGPGDHRTEVEGDEPLVAQALRDVPGDDALGEALDDGRLADAGVPDEDGVVLGAPGQDLHDAADLGVTADDRVELAVAGHLGQVRAVLLEGLEGALGRRGRDLAAATDLGDLRLDRVGVEAEASGAGDRRQQLVGRDVGVAHRRGRVAGLLQDGRGGLGGPGGAGGPGHGREAGEHLGGGAAHGLRVGAGRGDQRSGGGVLLAEQGEQEVGGLHLRVVRCGGVVHGRVDGLGRLGGQLHVGRLLWWDGQGVYAGRPGLTWCNLDRVEPIPLNPECVGHRAVPTAEHRATSG